MPLQGQICTFCAVFHFRPQVWGAHLDLASECALRLFFQLRKMGKSYSDFANRLGRAGIASPLPICDSAAVSSWIGGVFGSVGGPTLSIPEVSSPRCRTWPLAPRPWDAPFWPACKTLGSRGCGTKHSGKAGLTSQPGPKKSSATGHRRLTTQQTSDCRDFGRPRSVRVRASGSPPRLGQPRSTPLNGSFCSASGWVPSDMTRGPSAPDAGNPWTPPATMP